jgi:hypothetical protein
VLVAAGLLAACAPPPPQPVPITRPGDATGAAVARRPIPEVPPPVDAQSAHPKSGTASAVAPIRAPPGSQYVCVSEAGGVQKRTAIEFSPMVGELCVKHPEMGPCQYERNVCRASGGRVYDASGTEITLHTEAEYDKKVMRVRFRAN